MKLDNVIAKRATKTVYRDGNYAIKVFIEGYSKANILNEALNHARIEETELNIPEVEEVIKFGERWAIVTRFIEGKTLEQLMKENPKSFDKYLEMFVDIHLNVFKQEAPLLNVLKQKLSRKIDQADLKSVTKYDLHTRLEAMPDHYKVVHGDFNPSNIIITDEGTPYILDWSHAAQGNASADVAGTYCLFKLSGDEETAERYINMFCTKSGTDKRYVLKWLPIVAASQSVKSIPEERELLLKWVDVIDYE